MIWPNINRLFLLRHIRNYGTAETGSAPAPVPVGDAKLDPGKPSDPKAPKIRPKYLLAVHSGLGYNLQGKDEAARFEGIKLATEMGYKVLEESGKALDGVESAVRFMETHPWFNAGRGSSLTLIGTIEMDAGIMCGATLKSGGVSGVNRIEHPVTLARMVMDKTPHLALAMEGANTFASQLGFPRVQMQSLITDEAKVLHEKNIDAYPGMASAIALDPEGNLAIAVSSGGMNRKLPGRIGAAALVGSGFYAHNEIAAVSCTDDPAVMKANLAFEIIQTIGSGMSPLEAAQKKLLKLQLRLYRRAGTMVVTKDGDVAVAMTNDHMQWAFKRGEEFRFGNQEGVFMAK